MVHICCIAAHDSSNGAGITRDCIVAHDIGVWAHPVITAITEQSFYHVENIHPISPGILHSQLNNIAKKFPICAVKIGMIYSPECIEIVSHFLQQYSFNNIIIDPVLFSSGCEPLMVKNAYPIYTKLLLPLATLITPNKNELEILSNIQIQSYEEAIMASEMLSQKYNASILLKGGHFDTEIVTDYLIDRNNKIKVTHKRRNYLYQHGSGCVLSTAIACYLAMGFDHEKALTDAVDYTINYFDKTNSLFHDK